MLLRAIFMGKDRPSVLAAFRYLIRRGVKVEVVVGEETHGPQSLRSLAKQFEIPVATDTELYEHLDGTAKRDYDVENVDIVISFLYWKLVKRPLLDLPRIGALNVHPCPLPEFRGFAPYTFGILENYPHWGVSIHFMDEKLDTGDVVQVRRFEIDLSHETAFSLARRSQEQALLLFQEVVDSLLCGKELPRIPQRSAGRTFTKKDFERFRRIQPDDSWEQIERKIRAYWSPPHEGAVVTVNGRELTVITNPILREIAGLYDSASVSNSH